MARVVSGLVQSARDSHPTFDEARQPTGPAYRELANIIQELQDGTIGLLPEYTELETTVAFALPVVLPADFENGFTVAPCRLVTDVVVVSGSIEFPVALINADGRFGRNSPKRAAWQEGDTVFLRGPEDAWAAYSSVEITSLPVFSDADLAALQRPGATMPLPDAAAPAVIARLAAFFATRSDTLDAGRVARLQARADAAVAAYYRQVMDRLAGTAFYTQDTYGEGPG